MSKPDEFSERMRAEYQRGYEAGEAAASPAAPAVDPLDLERMEAALMPDRLALHAVTFVWAGRDEPPETSSWQCACGRTFAIDGVDEYAEHIERDRAGLAPAPQVEPLDDMPGALHYALGHMSDECDCDRIWSDIRRFHELQPDPLPAYSLQASPPPESPDRWADLPRCPYCNEKGMHAPQCDAPKAGSDSRAVALLRELVKASKMARRNLQGMTPCYCASSPHEGYCGNLLQATGKARAFLKESGAIPASPLTDEQLAEGDRRLHEAGPFADPSPASSEGRESE